MIRRPPRSTRTDTLFPTRRSSDRSRARWQEVGAGTTRRKTRYGCFLPDLTGLASTSPARLPHAILGEDAEGASRWPPYHPINLWTAPGLRPVRLFIHSDRHTCQARPVGCTPPPRPPPMAH